MKAKIPPKFQNIGLIASQKAERHKNFLLDLKANLEKRGCNLMWDEVLGNLFGDSNQKKMPTIMKKADMVITLGGDGTILKLMRDLTKRKDLLVFGVNLGTLGFLTESPKSTKVFELLDEFFDDKFHVDERLILRATVYRKGAKIATHLCLNDVVINQGNFARLISLKSQIDQRKMIDFKADGVIIATPTGSTGHSLSAGGPIIHPRIDAFIFTPICPSELSVRPIVIPSNRQITITVATDRRFADNQIGLTIDGQIVIPVEYGDIVKVRRSSRKLRFIRKKTGGGNYYRLLRDKLSWGKRG